MRHFLADGIMMAFGMHRVLSSVYLEAEAGKIIGILGANGAGKSALYKCMLGLYHDAKGSVVMGGNSIPLTKRLGYFGYLPQASFPPKDLTLRKGIAFLLGKGNTGFCGEDPVAERLLDIQCVFLSPGELRYAEALSVLSMERFVVLLDEPFIHIEPIQCESLCEKIKESSHGRITFVTDHLYRNVLEIVERVTILEDGELIAAPKAEESLVERGYLP
jgi:ABC-type lipopolysaccharide export system ATPase subunit